MRDLCSTYLADPAIMHHISVTANFEQLEWLCVAAAMTWGGKGRELNIRWAPTTANSRNVYIYITYDYTCLVDQARPHDNVDIRGEPILRFTAGLLYSPTLVVCVGVRIDLVSTHSCISSDHAILVFSGLY